MAGLGVNQGQKRKSSVARTDLNVAFMNTPMSPKSGGDWRDDCTSVKSRLTQVYQGQNRFTDATFTVGVERERIHVHKLVLRMTSVVFEDLLKPSSNNGTNNEYILVDVKPNIFKKVLKYAYTDEYDGLVDEALDILGVARNFKITHLGRKALEVLKKNIGYDNGFILYESARELNSTEAEDACLNFILKNADRMMSSSSWLSVKYRTLSEIFRSDRLQIWEIDLYRAALRWASAECHRTKVIPTPENQRAVLRSAFYLIRFPIMKPEDFTEHVVPLKILSISEILSCYQFMTALLATRSKVAFDLPFCSKPREWTENNQTSPGPTQAPTTPTNGGDFHYSRS